MTDNHEALMLILLSAALAAAVFWWIDRDMDRVYGKETRR